MIVDQSALLHARDCAFPVKFLVRVASISTLLASRALALRPRARFPFAELPVALHALVGLAALEFEAKLLSAAYLVNSAYFEAAVSLRLCSLSTLAAAWRPLLRKPLIDRRTASFLLLPYWFNIFRSTSTFLY